MIYIVYYLLKVLCCSLVLFGYYYIALRNKQFHQWNRFYLLLIVSASLIIPCIEFNIVQTSSDAKPIQLLHAVYSANPFVTEAASQEKHSISFDQVVFACYLVVSLLLLVQLSRSIYRIVKIINSHVAVLLHSAKFINTDIEGTPFSFLKFIFWNRNIDLDSENGRKIFRHEMVHVREHHTLDNLFMRLVLIFYWFNPVFWLIQREMKMIHEFIADEEAIGSSNTNDFAAIVLQASYPAYYNTLTSQFFQSSIKRRLAMIRKSNNKKISYWSRLLVLPVIAVVTLAFTIKTKSTGLESRALLANEIKVIIDPAHGGQTGSRAEQLFEDEIVLQLAKRIQETNTNSKIKIVLTRQSDENVSLQERVNFARKENADVFISLHMNAAPDASSSPLTPQEENNGIEITVSEKGGAFQAHAELLGSGMINELQSVYQTKNKLFKRQAGIYVLDKNICPAVLIDCGFITNEKDRSFMRDPGNQKIIAQRILKGIERYAAAIENHQAQPAMQTNDAADTVPKLYYKGKEITSISVRPTHKVHLTFKDKSTAIITMEEATKNKIVLPPPPPPLPATSQQKKELEEALLIIDGEEKGKLGTPADLEKLVPADRQVKEVHVYKAQEAIAKYGKKGEHGVISLTTEEKPAPPPPPPAPLKEVEKVIEPKEKLEEQHVQLEVRQSEPKKKQSALREVPAK